MKKLALFLVLVVFLVCGTPVSAGIEPVPWIIGKLGAIESQMTVVDQRINAAFTRMGIEPSPFTPFVNQMGAIDNQLNHVNRRLTEVFVDIDTIGLGSDLEIELALSQVLQATSQIMLTLRINTAIWAGLLPIEAQAILTQVSAGIEAISDLFEPYNPVLATPTGLRVVDESLAFQLELNWDPVVNASGYEVQWSASSTGPWLDFASPVTQTKAFDMPDPWDQYRFYRVRAYRTYGTAQWASAWTDPVGGTQNSSVVPSNFSATSTATSITVNWHATYAASGYQVNVIRQDILHIYTQTTGTTVTVSGLSPDTNYYVEVFSYQLPPAGSTGDTVFGPHTPPLYVKTKPIS